MCIKYSDNNVGRVKKQVLRFEMLLESGYYLKFKSHQSKFKESLENTYLSPEKKRRLCDDSITIPRHTASQGTRSSRPPLSHSSLSRSGSRKLISQSRHTSRLTRQARWTPSPTPGRQRSGSSTTGGSWASTTSPGKGGTWWTLTLSPPPPPGTYTAQQSTT